MASHITFTPGNISDEKMQKEVYPVDPITLDPIVQKIVRLVPCLHSMHEDSARKAYGVEPGASIQVTQSCSLCRTPILMYCRDNAYLAEIQEKARLIQENAELKNQLKATKEGEVLVAIDQRIKSIEAMIGNLPPKIEPELTWDHFLTKETCSFSATQEAIKTPSGFTITIKKRIEIASLNTSSTLSNILITRQDGSKVHEERISIEIHLQLPQKPDAFIKFIKNEFRNSPHVTCDFYGTQGELKTSCLHEMHAVDLFKLFSPYCIITGEQYQTCLSILQKFRASQPSPVAF